VLTHALLGSRPAGRAVEAVEPGPAGAGGGARRGSRWFAVLLAATIAATAAMVAPSFASAAAVTTPQISHTPAGDLKTGETFVETLAVKNTGDAATQPGAEPTDALGLSMEIPETLEVIGFSVGTDPFWQGNALFPDGCTTINLGATQLICYANQASTLDPDETSPEIEITLRVKPTTTGTVNLMVQSAGGGGDNATASDSFNVIPAPALALDKSHSGLFKRSSEATYDLAVANEGPQPTTGTVTIVDELPAGLSYNSASSDGNYWDCSAVGQAVTCDSDAVIASGASAPTLHLTVDVDAGAPTSVINEATVSSPDAASGSDSDPTPIYSSAAQLIRYSVNPTEIATQEGQTGSFFRLRNLFNDSNVFLDFTQLVNKPVFTGAYEPSDDSVSIDQSGVDFPTYTIPNLDAGLEALGQKVFVDVDVDFVPTAAWSGTHDPDTGEANLNMKMDIRLSIKLASVIPGLLVGICETGETDVNPLTTGAMTPPDPGVTPPPVTSGLPFGPDSNGAFINNDVSVTGPPCRDVNPLITALAGLDAAGLAVAVNGLLGTPANPGATDLRLETHAAFPDDNPALTMKVAPQDKIVLGTGGAYEYSIKNESSQPTDGSTITVTDTLPDGLAYVSDDGSDPSWSCSAAGQDVTCENDGTYAAGASLPTLLVNVSTVGDDAFPSVVNFAAVGGGGSEGEFIASHATSISAPEFALTMGSDTGNYVVGTDAILRPNVQNPGGEPTAGEITLVGQLPRGMTFKSASAAGGFACTAGNPTAAGQTVTCKTTTPIAPGATVTPLITVGISSQAAETIHTTWSVSGGGAPEAANASVTSAERPVVQSELSVTATHTGDFAVGSQGQYTVNLRNTGLGATGVNPVTVSVNLPNGLEFVSASPSGGNNYWQCSTSGQLVECTNTTPAGVGRSINPNASATPLVITVDVGSEAYPSVTTRVSASGGAASNVSNAADITNVTATPALDVHKTHVGDQRGEFTAGEEGAYELVVDNHSPVDSDGSTVTVTDSLPAGLTFESASSEGDYWSCSNSGQDVTCTSDEVIAAGAAAPTLTINTEVGDAAVPGVTNTAEVTGGGFAGTAESSDSVIVNPAPTPPPNPNKPILEIDKSHQGDFQAGQSGEYKLAVSNSGEVDSSGTVKVIDALPIGLTYESASGSGWTCSAAGQKVTCTSDAAIAAGGAAAAIDLKVKVDGDAAPGVTNTASVQGGGAVAQAVASDPTKVNPAPKPKLTAVKVTPKTKKVKAGKAATLKVKVTNGGNAKASGVSVCAKVPKAKAKAPACKRIAVAAGSSKTVKLKVKTKKKAKGNAKVKVTAKSGAAGSRSGSATLKIER